MTVGFSSKMIKSNEILIALTVFLLPLKPVTSPKTLLLFDSA